MINEIAMALMFAAVFILVVSAVIVGGRMGKTKTRKASETDEAPKEPPKKQEPLPESPPTEVEQHPESLEILEAEPRLYMPEPDLLAREQTTEIYEREEVEETVRFFEPVSELSEMETEYTPKTMEAEQEVPMPEVVSPEPVLLEQPQTEEPVDTEPFEDTYREPSYFRDEDVSPVQGVTTCPHCGEKVPATLYCINCGKSLNE